MSCRDVSPLPMTCGPVTPVSCCVADQSLSLDGGIVTPPDFLLSTVNNGQQLLPTLIEGLTNTTPPPPPPYVPWQLLTLPDIMLWPANMRDRTPVCGTAGSSGSGATQAMTDFQNQQGGNFGARVGSAAPGGGSNEIIIAC